MATNDELRSALGKIGIWMPPPAAAGVDPAGFGREIEQAGFRSVWFPDIHMHPDGKQIAFANRNGDASEIWALENFLPPLAESKPAAAADISAGEGR